MPVPLPLDEDARLRELYRCGLLDTPPEPAFDRVTRLAAHIFNVPMAFVSLVDRDRQWFKSHHGVELAETPRDGSFCAYTILGTKAMVVPDASRDRRFADSVLVTGPAATRFYAGAPLTTPDGHRLGTLCISDTVPRELSEDEVALLEDLAGGLSEELARRLFVDDLQREREELEAHVQERTAELALFNGTLLQQISDRERAEENARRSEMKFRALVENAQDLTSIVAPEGVVLYITPSAEHLLGHAPDDLIGRDLFKDLIHPDDREELRAQFARIVAEGSRYVRSETRYRHRDGSWRLLESIASCAPPDFPIVSLVVNSRDITDRRRGEIEHETQVRLQTAVAELGRFALQGPDLAAIFDKSAGLVTHALDIAFCTVTELLPGSQQLLIRAGRGWRENAVGHNVESWRTVGADGNLVNPEPLVVNDLLDRPLDSVLPRDARDDAPVCAVSVVIQSGGRSFGTICVLSATPREFTVQDVTFLQTVADLLATLIQSKRQEDASREAEARFQHIVANLPGVVYQYCRRLDGTTVWPFMSEGSRQLFEIEAADLQNDPGWLLGIIHPDDRAAYDAAGVVSTETLRPFEWEGRIRLPSGAQRWITARSRPELRANGDIVWDGVMLDVSELKRAQETMREAKEEAEKANRAKSEFLSRMSHELRTPLNAILGFGQLLALEDFAPVQASSVEQILKSGRHLLDLINEVLDIARIDAGSMEMLRERVDAGAMLTEAARFTRPLAEQHRVAFINGVAVGGGFAVTADRGRLKQVLLNLFSNAVKFNREGGEVSFTCGSAPDGRSVRLSVSDTGPGMAADEMARLFTPFQRLNAVHQGIPGTGVGLAVAKSLVEAMGGSIGVRSEPGRGSTFFVDMPAAPPEDTASRELPPPAEAAAAPPRVRTILNIDDQPSNLSLLERMFETRADLRLIAAPDGRSGLALARDRRPDLILLDLHLPDIPGDEVLRRLHNEPATRDIPIIVLTADAGPGQMARLRQLGAREYITKPFKISELLHSISALLDPPRPPP